jgi:DNA replication and repair protein RecF
MWLRTLRVEHFRSFAAADCALEPGPNVFVGPNGAGKTSLLEAAYLLSHGRSFRAGGHEAVVARGADRFRVYAEVARDDGRNVRLGIERESARWQARREGERVARLSDLFLDCAVVCFEPGSHELIGGGSPERRAFLDWGVFHVERTFLDVWRRYQRALKQRNQALRDRAPDAELDVWDAELIRSGERLTALRRDYLDRLGPAFTAATAALLPELGAGRLEFGAGYDDALETALAQGRVRDRVRQTTTRGPHRADWRPVFDGAPQREHLSRGQEKLTALAAVLAQARCFRSAAGEWPVLALDDLPSELDPAHQALVVAEIRQTGVQTLLTATHLPPALEEQIGPAAQFHVERGTVARVA